MQKAQGKTCAFFVFDPIKEKAPLAQSLIQSGISSKTAKCFENAYALSRSSVPSGSRST
jgi:hypothetical protein